jgi:hypothetical protein
MTEEVKQDEIKEKEESKEEVTYTDMEKRALAMGWRPESEWQGNSEDFIDAKEFVRRKPLFDKINSTTTRLKSVEEALNQLASHHQKVKETEYQRALKELRLEKRAALKEGDTVVALELEDKMDELTEQRQQEVKEVKENQVQGPTPEFLTWVKDNDWYLTDEDMHDFADGTAAAYIQRSKLKGVQLSEEHVFQHVLDKVKRAYPEKFENPNRQRASTVSTSDRNGKSTKSTYKPTEEERSIAKNFVKQGVFKTEEEYYKERQEMTNG